MSEIIDSRDLIARIDELQAMRDAHLESIGLPMPEADLDEDEAEELAELLALADQGIEDWIYGATLIREDYFVAYAQDLAQDIGAIGRDMQWPLSHIDWEAAADALKLDYTEVELGGHTYYVRA